MSDLNVQVSQPNRTPGDFLSPPNNRVFEGSKCWVQAAGVQLQMFCRCFTSFLFPPAVSPVLYWLSSGWPRAAPHPESGLRLVSCEQLLLKRANTLRVCTTTTTFCVEVMSPVAATGVSSLNSLRFHLQKLHPELFFSWWDWTNQQETQLTAVGGAYPWRRRRAAKWKLLHLLRWELIGPIWRPSAQSPSEFLLRGRPFSECSKCCLWAFSQLDIRNISHRQVKHSSWHVRILKLPLSGPEGRLPCCRKCSVK